MSRDIQFTLLDFKHFVQLPEGKHLELAILRTPYWSSAELREATDVGGNLIDHLLKMIGDRQTFNHP